MKGTTIRLGVSKRTAVFFKNNIAVLIFTLLCLCGYVFGIFTVKNFGQDTGRFFHLFFESFINIRLDGGYFSIFSSSFLTALLYVIIAFISGISLAGIPFLPVLVIVKGFLYGIISGSAVSQYSFKGMAFTAAVIAVPAIISGCGTVLACREAFGFSTYMLKTFSKGSNGGFAVDFKVYCVRYLVILCLTALAAVADTLLSVFFAGLFGIT